MLGSGKPKTGRPRRFSDREGRSKKLCIRISEGDLKLVEKGAKMYGMTKTDFVIMCIREGAEK